MNSLAKINVIQKDDELVVDSRLIAKELGIEHRSFFRTIKKYQTELQQGFGILRFEITKLEGRGRPEEFCYLTESQATFLMTLSKNTLEVIACKLNLVSAFERAKQIIKTVIPQQNDHIRELELRLQLAQAETQKALAEKAVLDARHLIVATCPEPVQQKILGYSVVEKVEYRDRIIHGQDLINDGSTINKTALCRRYGFVSKSGKPDYIKLNRHLDSLNVPDYAWENVPSIRENQELRRDYLEELDKKIIDDSRQLWFGE